MPCAALLTLRSSIVAFVGPFTQAHYPESDGKPLGETDEHRDAMVRHIQILQEYYRDQRVYVSGDLLVYYAEGTRASTSCPMHSCTVAGTADCPCPTRLPLETARLAASGTGAGSDCPACRRRKH